MFRRSGVFRNAGTIHQRFEEKVRATRDQTLAESKSKKAERAPMPRDPNAPSRASQISNSSRSSRYGGGGGRTSSNFRPERTHLFVRAMDKIPFVRNIAKMVYRNPKPEVTFSRYGRKALFGARSDRLTKFGVPVFIGIFTVQTYSTFMAGHDAMANVEINRKKYYDTPFDPDAPDEIDGEKQDFDWTKGSAGREKVAHNEHLAKQTLRVMAKSSEDKETGLYVDADGTPRGPSYEELKKRVAQKEVTPSMLNEMKLNNLLYSDTSTTGFKHGGNVVAPRQVGSAPY